MIFDKKKGDIVYIPSSAYIFKYNGATPIWVSQTKKPEYAIFIDQVEENKCIVYLQNQFWRVAEEDVYEISK